MRKRSRISDPMFVVSECKTNNICGTITVPYGCDYFDKTNYMTAFEIYICAVSTIVFKSLQFVTGILLMWVRGRADRNKIISMEVIIINKHIISNT
jgi:hypothetical protein